MVRQQATRPDRGRASIPTVRLLGTSWYRRGPGYWFRRVALTLVYLLVFALSAVFAGIAIDVIATQAKSWLRIVLLAVAIVGIAWSFVTGFRAISRTPEEKASGRPLAFRNTKTPRTRRAAGGAGLGLGVGAYAGSAIAGGLVVFGQLFVVGWIAAMAATSLGRYLSVEEYEAAKQGRP